MSGGVPPSSRAGRRRLVRGQLRQAADLYERFSGHDPDVVDVVPIQPIAPDAQIAAVLVGTLDGVLYTTERDGQVEKYIHRFAARDKPALAVSADGRRMFIIGGRYRFTELGIVDDSDVKHRNAR